MPGISQIQRRHALAPGQAKHHRARLQSLRVCGLSTGANGDKGQPGRTSDPASDVEKSKDRMDIEGQSSFSSKFRHSLFQVGSTAKVFLQQSVAFLKQNFLAIVLVHELCALICFGLQHVSYRCLNEAAIRFLNISPAMLQDLWAASSDPVLMNFDTGYQQLSIVFYLLVLPFTALFRSLAAGATVILCSQLTLRDGVQAVPTPSPSQAQVPESGADKGDDGVSEANAEQSNVPDDPKGTKKPGLFGRMKNVFSDLWKVASELRPIWVQVWIVELLVTMRVMPMEALSYLVITLYWTLPRILDLQLAVVSSVKEKLQGKAALNRSRLLAKDGRWSMLVVMLGTLMSARAIEVLQAQVLFNLPARIFADVPEIPVVVTFLAYIGNRIAHRIRDIVPIVAYCHLIQRDSSGASQPGK